MPSMALAARMSWREVPLRLGAMAHEDRELRAARTTLRRQHDRPVRTRFRRARPGGSPFRHDRFRSFRRQARICRRVPRWTGASSAQRGAAYWRAGGLR
jgi:hypothetical protein